MITLYRIIDETTNTIVAESMSSREHAYETLTFYTLDYPTHTFAIESYSRSSVKPGFGRDPDLH
jgi:hypothetical protein